MEVRIGGEPRTLGGFSAFKAFKAMEILGNAESIYRRVLSESAAFTREFEAENVVELDRAEARRQFRPQPVYEQTTEETETGSVATATPVLIEGEPLLGPDPLGHLTDADWEASGNRLRIGKSPSEDVKIAAMIPRAFELGRLEATRLLALAITPNADLEKWDNDGDVDAELETVAKRLLHQATADELVALAIATLRLCKEQISGPFGELVEAARTTFRAAKDPETTATGESGQPEPMRVVTPGSPTSSSESPADSDGNPESSSTALASASSSNSETA